jgi:predicted acylesterase/phospholipase RssA
MEGGGPRNAYTVGALKAIVDLLPSTERSYDVISGVSMAAINAFIMGMHAIGDEKTAINELLRFWGELNEDKVYENWSFGVIEGFLTRSGLYNNEPFTKTIQKLRNNYNHTFKRNFSISMTDLNTGNLSF